MEFSEVIAKRISIRKYKDTPVEPEKIAQLIQRDFGLRPTVEFTGAVERLPSPLEEDHIRSFNHVFSPLKL